MESETRRRIEAAVMEILQDADIEEATEYKIRMSASEKLGLDLSLPDCKLIVSSVVQSFANEQTAAHKEAAAAVAVASEAATATATAEVFPEVDEEEEERKNTGGAKEYTDDGDLVVCKLSNKRKVTIQDFRGRKLVSIREYYDKGGKQMPSSKGISLTVEQWEAFSKAVPSIEEAIRKLEGSD